MSHLAREIAEQPRVVAALLHAEADVADDIAARIRAHDPAFVMIAARGSSDNAARYAQYLFGDLLRLPVALAAPSLFTLAGARPRLGQGLVLGISQSGQSPDVVAVVEAGRDQGALTVAVTNDGHSPLARAAAHVLQIHAGVERSVAASKTYTASLAALALIAVSAIAETGERRRALGALRQAPELIERSLEMSADPVAQAAADWPRAARAVVLGRGFNYATAHEIALKLGELAYISAEAYSSAEFRHGPIAKVAPDLPLLAVTGDGPFDADVAALAAELRASGARLVTLGAPDADLPAAPAPAPWLAPFAAVAPGQLLAMTLAGRQRGDIDSPRGLSKVTRTR